MLRPYRQDRSVQGDSSSSEERAHTSREFRWSFQALS